MIDDFGLPQNLKNIHGIQYRIDNTMNKMIAIIILSIVSLILIIIIVTRISGSYEFDKDVSELFSQSQKTTNKTFHYEQLAGLPEPVYRYFRHVLKEGQPYIRYIRLKHDGQFKTDPHRSWADIIGEQYFTTQKPGFAWKGATNFFTARDMYIAGKGRLVVTALSMFKIVDNYGEKINQGELLRWLGESVWFPTNLLPGEHLQWSPINSSSAKLTFNYNGLSVFYIVSINNIGEITQVESKRYMVNSLETWIGRFSNYKEMNGVIIPTKIEGAWKLLNEDFTYAKFNIKSIEYDKPEKF